MFTRHFSEQLEAHLDGELAPQSARQVESHLRECRRCAAEREEIEWGIGLLEQLPRLEAPELIWSSIEASLAADRPRAAPRPLWLRWALAAALLLCLAGAAYWRTTRPADPAWVVLRVAGSPSVDAKQLNGRGWVRPGEWIETDTKSRATIEVGGIGSVEVSPNTRLRVVEARAGEHRLRLAHGQIQAAISAPPKLFFVDTAAGTAIDLGCEYTLDASEDGSGLLRVTKGWVSFQWKELESLVPAGASCRTWPESGPGIPYFNDAPEGMRQALDAFRGGKSGERTLDVILAQARVRDTLSLWHLLSRVDPADRGRVFDRMAELTPLPAGVSRDLALKLDAPALKRWREELAWTW